MTLSIRTRTIQSRYWLLAAFGAILLIAGCAAPQESGRPVEPVAATIAASSAAPEVPSPAPTASVPVVETPAEPTAEAPASETVAAPAPAAIPVPAAVPVTEAESTTAPVAEAPAVEPSGYGCDAAIAYLHANAHPAFTIVCPGYAFGGQAVTCINHAPQCPNSAVIIINVPCAVAYMNEAANSWALYNGTGAAIDPFGASC